MLCFSGPTSSSQSSRKSLLVLIAAATTSFAAFAQAPAKKSERLIPVTNALVVQKCASCHAQDAQGNMSRISSIRTTPEGWEEAIKRMVRLNGLQISPEDARTILRYLSDTHGLAPEEATKVQYFAEHRIQDESFPGVNEDIRHACGSCHALAKPMSWRRTPEDWDYLKNMHLAFFPSIDGSFRRSGLSPAAPPAAPGDAPGAPPKQPVDIALEYVKKSNVLLTPEWSNWSSQVQAPKLAGGWNVAGRFPGKGKFYGTVKIADKGNESYGTETELHFVDGGTWKGSGESLVYTGFQWRGRVKGDTKVQGIDDPSGIRQVMSLSKDGDSFTGRWFWGTYQEFGLDVKMTRDTGAVAVLGTDVSSLKTGSTDTPVRIFGNHLPTISNVADVSLGQGVTVTKIVSSTPDGLTVTASVDPKAGTGLRSVSLPTATAPEALAVYDKMDYLAVTPNESIAHLGSEPHAKGYMQFEAAAFNNGPDGKAHTADDVPLGPVAATWKIEEFVASFGDDDVQYVGMVDEKTGLFTPASDGPNPKRKSMRNNYGDVWTVATYTPTGAEKPLIGRAYFVVSVPQYLQWDQPEVGQ
jgi:quinohemoprotein amine dehydrogenase